MQIRYALGALAIVVLILSACGGQDTPALVNPNATTAPVTTAPSATMVPTVEQAPDDGTITTAATPLVESEPVPNTEPVAVAAPTEDTSTEARPAWQSLPLTNARTGESFTLADFAGKTVFVEPFATWCTNCRQQLNYVNQARANFGEDVVFIALSVEPNIGNEALAQYATEQGFDLIFAAMSPDLLREIAALLGQTITNPPATPHFIIRADGSTTELFTGIEGPEAITRLIQSAQG
jgi:thiol-disulfide isomerase/thioredoxin